MSAQPERGQVPQVLDALGLGIKEGPPEMAHDAAQHLALLTAAVEVDLREGERLVSAQLSGDLAEPDRVGDHPMAARNPATVSFERHHGVTVHPCEPADPVRGPRSTDTSGDGVSGSPVEGLSGSRADVDGQGGGVRERFGFRRRICRPAAADLEDGGGGPDRMDVMVRAPAPPTVTRGCVRR
jgi:hypothetical protein